RELTPAVLSNQIACQDDLFPLPINPVWPVRHVLMVSGCVRQRVAFGNWLPTPSGNTSQRSDLLTCAAGSIRWTERLGAFVPVVYSGALRTTSKRCGLAISVARAWTWSSRFRGD